MPKQTYAAAVRFLTLLIFTALLGLGPAAADDSYDPTKLPGFPPQPPPKAERPAKSEARDREREQTPGETRTFKLEKGWNLLSFPFAGLTEIRGLEYCLYHYTSGTLFTDNPREPEKIDTRKGYMAYSDKDAEITVTGALNKGFVKSTPLDAGWNLIGCPGETGIELNRAVIINGNLLKTIPDAIAGSIDKAGDFWLSPTAYSYKDNFYGRKILDSQTVISPGEGLWIFAWHPSVFAFESLAENETAKTPEIDRIEPDSVKTGGEVILYGKNFGGERDYIVLKNKILGENDILQWEDEKIDIRIPAGYESGDLLVVKNHAPSNKSYVSVSSRRSAAAEPDSRQALNLETGPAGPGPAGTPFPAPETPAATSIPTAKAPSVPTAEAGSVSGRVTSPTGQPLAGAAVTLSNGQTTITDGEGNYDIKNVPGGEYKITVSTQGHNTASGTITVEQGKNRSVLTSLSPSFMPPAPGQYDESFRPRTATPRTTERTERKKAPSKKEKIEYGTITVKAYNFHDRGIWAVQSIKVEQADDFKSWSNSWDPMRGERARELYCRDAILGKEYRITITWKSRGAGNTKTRYWTKTMESRDQKFIFDSSYY